VVYNIWRFSGKHKVINEKVLNKIRIAIKDQVKIAKIGFIQDVPPIHKHLDPGMELDSGSSNAMEIGQADAEWLIRNAQKLNGESTRSDFVRNYMLCPDV
jgi:hypothetical protein